MYKSIKIQAIVENDKAQVWDHYTNPDHIVNWNFANDEWCCPNASNDLRVGGKYDARMEAKDGSFGFNFEAIYDTVDQGNMFQYTAEDGRKVAVKFNELDNDTVVNIEFDAENENPIEMQKGGWQAILNNFKKYSESQK